MRRTYAAPLICDRRSCKVSARTSAVVSCRQRLSIAVSAAAKGQAVPGQEGSPGCSASRAQCAELKRPSWCWFRQLGRAYTAALCKSTPAQCGCRRTDVLCLQPAACYIFLRFVHFPARFLAPIPGPSRGRGGRDARPAVAAADTLETSSRAESWPPHDPHDPREPFPSAASLLRQTWRQAAADRLQARLAGRVSPPTHPAATATIAVPRSESRSPAVSAACCRLPSAVAPKDSARQTRAIHEAKCLVRSVPADSKESSRRTRKRAARSMQAQSRAIRSRRQL